MLSCPKPANRANQKQNMMDCGTLWWPRSLLSWPTIGFLKKKTSLIVGHLCPENNDDNIVAIHNRQ